MLFDSIGGFARILLQTGESPSGCSRCARILLTVLKSSMFVRSFIQTLTTVGLCALLMLCACVASAHEGPHGGQVTAPVSSPEAPMSRDADSLVTTLLPWCPGGGSGRCCCNEQIVAAPTHHPSFDAPTAPVVLVTPNGGYELGLHAYAPVYSRRLLIHSIAPRGPPAPL